MDERLKAFHEACDEALYVVYSIFVPRLFPMNENNWEPARAAFRAKMRAILESCGVEVPSEAN